MIIQPATLGDLLYIDSLRRVEQECVGFIPMSRYEREITEHRKRLLVALEDGDRVGFVFWTEGWPVARIQQLVVQRDARRMDRGTALVEEVIRSIPHHTGLTCRCREDIDGIEFWSALGWQNVGKESGGRRGVPLVRFYRKCWPSLFHAPVISTPVIMAQRKGFRLPLRGDRQIQDKESARLDQGVLPFPARGT